MSIIIFELGKKTKRKLEIEILHCASFEGNEHLRLTYNLKKSFLAYNSATFCIKGTHELRSWLAGSTCRWNWKSNVAFSTLFLTLNSSANTMMVTHMSRHSHDKQILLLTFFHLQSRLKKPFRVILKRRLKILSLHVT